MITKTSEAWDTFQKISLKYRDPWDTFQKIREIRLDEALPDWGYVSKDATTTEREPFFRVFRDIFFWKKMSNPQAYLLSGTCGVAPSASGCGDSRPLHSHDGHQVGGFDQ